MKKYHLIIYVFISIFSFSCKKDNTVSLSSENNILSFAISGQLSIANIDNNSHTVNLIIPYTIVKTAINASYSTSKNDVVTIDGSVQQGNTITGDFSKPVTMTITAPNGNISTWTIIVSSDMEAYGLGHSVTASNSLNKPFNWYYDQGNSGQFSSINCGPAAVTMAIKWSDSTFTKTAEDARKTYRSTGGLWYTTDIVNYLSLNGINSAYTTLPDNYQTIKNFIDKNYIIILCLDNYYIRYNANATQHIDKFYQIANPASGHFIVVKGYRQVDSKFYFEVYDPGSMAETYPSTTKLKGQDRYYLSDDLEQATNLWWDWAIVVAPKGKQVTSSNGLKILSLKSFIPAQKGE